MARAPYTINFRFVGNAQTGTAKRSVNQQNARDSRGRFQKLQSMFNTIVDDVALNAADRTYSSARASLESSVTAEIQKELTQMARMVGKFLVQPAGATGPKGNITSTQTSIADQTRSIYGRNNILRTDLSSFNSYWGFRDPSYVNRKRKEGFTKDWWKRTGELQKKLSQESLYKELGPIRVSFTKGEDNTKGKAKQTLSGRKGNLSKTYSVGRLSVQVMERVTLDMLGNAISGQGKLVPELFRDKDIRNKLMSHGSKHYRAVLEPFLSYYLTRAIPNAVFLRTERLINSEVSAAKAARLGGGVKTSLGFGRQGT